jgi:hypothetical protein
MEIQPFVFGIYLLTGSYLLWKVIGITLYIRQAVNHWWLRYRPAGRLATVDQPDGQKFNHAYTFNFIGFLSGVGVVLIFSQRFQPTLWPLLVLVTIGLVLEELRPSRAHRNLPDVITLISICRAATERGYNLSDAFRFALPRLPPSQVKTSLEGVMHRQRRGMPIVQCLTPLARCNRYLAEFAAFYEGGGSSHTGLFQLSAILHRARWEWARNNQTYLLLNKAQKYLYPLRSFILGGLIITFVSKVPDIHRTLALLWTKLFI